MNPAPRDRRFALVLLLAVVACVLVVVVFERFGDSAALGAVGVMVLAGVLAAFRRVPGAVWWTVGAVIGGCLAFLS